MSASSTGLAALAAKAPPEAVDLARMILEQAVSDERWAAQVGPVLGQRDVARLLGKSPQAVAQDRGLLRLRQRDGRPAYPVFQFDGRRQIGGITEVVAVLGAAVEPLTVAAWLTGPNRRLCGRRPIDLLRAAQAEPVLDAAYRYARAAA